MADLKHADQADRLRGMLIDDLATNGSPPVNDGSLSSGPPETDVSKNPSACRGPMRGGMGD